MQDEKSILKKAQEIEYFLFEEDFVEKGIRCIPMIVRFNMDAAGVKLKLLEWSLLSERERTELAIKSCRNENEIAEYKRDVLTLIKKYTNSEPTLIALSEATEWETLCKIPSILEEMANEFDWKIELNKWQHLTSLQRFALLKLCRPGHENKNFPKAMKEFNLIT